MYPALSETKSQQDYGSELLPRVAFQSIIWFFTLWKCLVLQVYLSAALSFFILPMNVWDLVTSHLSVSIK